AVRPKETEDHTRSDAEGEILHRGDFTEGLAQVAKNDDRFAHVEKLIALMNAYLQPSLTRRYLGQMRREIMDFTRLARLFCVLLFTGGLSSIFGAADPVAELTSFSVFDKIDLNELAKSDAKILHGPPMN